jgi:hypothetical protein
VWPVCYWSLLLVILVSATETNHKCNFWMRHTIWYMIWHAMTWHDIWYIIWCGIWCDIRCDMIYETWYDIFNCNWVDTQWQYFSTHLHTNSTQNTETGTYITINKFKINLGSAAVPRLYELYPGICLATEEKQRKPSVRRLRNFEAWGYKKLNMAFSFLGCIVYQLCRFGALGGVIMNVILLSC